jgi:hypothetical protein
MADGFHGLAERRWTRKSKFPHCAVVQSLPLWGTAWCLTANVEEIIFSLKRERVGEGRNLFAHFFVFRAHF